MLLVAACLGAAVAYGCSTAPPAGDDPSGEGGSSETNGGSGGKAAGGSGGRVSNTGGTQAEGGKGGKGDNGGNVGSGGESVSTGGSGGGAANGGSTGDGGNAGAGVGGGGGEANPDGPPAADGGSTGSGGSGAGGGLPPGPYKVVLLYSNDHAAADASLKDMAAVLSGMKATHDVVLEMILDSDANAKADKLGDKALVIVGPNTRACSGGVDTNIKNLTVPVMISKDCTSWSGLGNMMNTPNTLQAIKIVKTDHPLAAGLSGTVRVYTDNVCREVRGAGVGPDAIKIANTPVDANSWAIFAYEKGGMMPGGKAPAKRIGFFWHRPSGATPEGKKLFQAAVEWAIRP